MTMDGWDAKAGLNAMIFRPDGVPAEGNSPSSSAKKPAPDFEVQTLDGRIEFFLTGGSTERDKDLRVMIEQLLKRS